MAKLPAGYTFDVRGSPASGAYFAVARAGCAPFTAFVYGAKGLAAAKRVGASAVRSMKSPNRCRPIARAGLVFDRSGLMLVDGRPVKSWRRS